MILFALDDSVFNLYSIFISSFSTYFLMVAESFFYCDINLENSLFSWINFIEFYKISDTLSVNSSILSILFKLSKTTSIKFSFV